MLKFEWDYTKAKANKKKHQITFQEASTIFFDPLSDTFYDPGHSIDENRYITIGMSEFMNILVVAYTYKNDIIRIVSARKATKRERRYYENG